MIFTLVFWKAAAERAVKTFAQVLGALLIADPVAGLLDINWSDAFSVAGLGAAVSVLTSIGSAATGPGPSLFNSEVIQLANDVGEHRP